MFIRNVKPSIVIIIIALILVITLIILISNREKMVLQIQFVDDDFSFRVPSDLVSGLVCGLQVSAGHQHTGTAATEVAGGFLSYASVAAGDELS